MKSCVARLVKIVICFVTINSATASTAIFDLDGDGIVHQAISVPSDSTEIFLNVISRGGIPFGEGMGRAVMRLGYIEFPVCGYSEPSQTGNWWEGRHFLPYLLHWRYSPSSTDLAFLRFTSEIIDTKKENAAQQDAAANP